MYVCLCLNVTPVLGLRHSLFRLSLSPTFDGPSTLNIPASGFRGSDRIEWVRLEALSEATLFNDSLIDGPKTVPRPSTAVSSENEYSLRHAMGY